MLIKYRNYSGFTLIELLVVISIITLLVIGATAGYGNYSNKNLLKQAALTLKNDLRLIQTNALSGKKPEGCTKLSSYEISFTGSGYTLIPFCDPEGAIGSGITVTFPNGIIMPTPTASPTHFLVLSNGTDISGFKTISLSGVAGTYTIQIQSSGDIIDKGITP